MPVHKLSVAIEPDVVRGARKSAARAGKSLSAWLNEAARNELRAEAGLSALAAWEAEHGPITPAEEERAARALARATRRPRRRA